MATATIAKKTLPENEDKELTPILDELSHDPDIKLDQMKSLIIVCLAFHEFSEYTVKDCIRSLRPYKRQQLLTESVSFHSTSAHFLFGQPVHLCNYFLQIFSIPLGVDEKHLENNKIFMDSDLLQSIHLSIGFKEAIYQPMRSMDLPAWNLDWSRGDVYKKDMVTAGLFLAIGSHKV